MPKISTKWIRIEMDAIDQRFEYAIMYNQKYLFYTEIPATFAEPFDCVSDEEKKNLNMISILRFYGDKEPHKRLITATTEKELEEKFELVLKKLSSLSLSKRKVLIIFFNNESDKYARGRDADEKESFGWAGLTMRMEYGTEVKIGTNVPKYYRYSTYEFNGEEHESRSELHVSNNDNHIVIDDTNENRTFIEDIHNKLKILSDKLEEYTKTPEALLSLMASNQKLIS